MSSNLPKAVAIIALGFVGAMSAANYGLTSQTGPEGKIVIATGGLPHYQELAVSVNDGTNPVYNPPTP